MSDHTDPDPTGDTRMSRKKRPVFMLDTAGKSKQQMKDEAREAIRKYQKAQQQENQKRD
jgi:hypothetical protein